MLGNVKNYEGKYLHTNWYYGPFNCDILIIGRWLLYYLIGKLNKNDNKNNKTVSGIAHCRVYYI